MAFIEPRPEWFLWKSELRQFKKAGLVALTGIEPVYEATAVNMKLENRLHGEPVFDITAPREDWRPACHKLKLAVYDPKIRSYRGGQLHDFRRTAATNMNGKNVPESKAMAVTGHKNNSMFNVTASKN
jgi:hypothetical protein